MKIKMLKKKIMISGGESRFCFYLKKHLKNNKLFMLIKRI